MAEELRVRGVYVRVGGEGDRGGSAVSRSTDGGVNVAAARRVGEGDRCGGEAVVVDSEGREGGGKKDGSVCRL